MIFDTTEATFEQDVKPIMFARCVRCHGGPFLTDQKFHNVGLRPAPVAVVFVDRDDPGAARGLTEALADPLNTRGKFSDGDDGRLLAPTAADAGSFRTPGLRCISRHPSFMHTGQLTRLSRIDRSFSRRRDIDRRTAFTSPEALRLPTRPVNFTASSTTADAGTRVRYIN